MSDTPARLADRPARWEEATGATLAIVVVLFPRSSPALLLILGLLAALQLWRHGGGRTELLRVNAFTLSIFALAAWSLVTCLWSPEPLESASKVVLFASCIAAGILLLKCIARDACGVGFRLSCGLAFGVAVAGLMVAFEVLTDQWFTRTVYNLLPCLGAQQSKHSTYMDGIVVAVGETPINRRTFTWTVLAPIAAGFFASLGRSGMAKIALASLVVSAASILYGSTHQTSQLMVLLMAVIGALYAVSPASGRRLVIIGFAALAFLSVPVSLLAFEGGLHKAPWLFASARHRVVIWAHTSELALKKPIAGIGVDGTKFLHEIEKNNLAPNDWGLPPQRLGRHAHNIYIQAFFETGLVGLLLLFVAGLLAALRIGRLPTGRQAIAMAIFGSAAAGMAISYSMWQPWIIGLAGLAVVLFNCLLDGRAVSENSGASHHAEPI